MKTIAIIGAGFGGLTAARKLGELFVLEPRLEEEYRILLIDQHSYQLYSPTLYEIATTSTDLAKNTELQRIVTLPISEAIRGLAVEFLQDKVQKIDLKNETLTMESGPVLPWHSLIIACGAETNFYGIPGMAERSLPFKTFIDAVRVRNAIEAAFSDPVSKPIRIVIGGGGFTGVELSAELAGWIKHLEKRYRKRGACKIILCESGPEILSMLEPNLMNAVRTRIEDLGIVIRTDAAIKRVKETEIELDTGEKIAFSVLIWTGGVKAPAILSQLGIKHDHKGRLETDGTMNCAFADERLAVRNRVFVIGDAACYVDPKTKRPVPGMVKTAIEQGRIAAFNAVADIRGYPKKEYRSRAYPYIIPVGGKWAAAKIGPFVFSGFLGWKVKKLEELGYLIAVLPNLFAIKTWLRGLWVFIRND